MCAQFFFFFQPSNINIYTLKRPLCLATLKSCDTTKQSVDDTIYAPPRGLSTLAKELTAANRVMQSFSNELRTLMSDKSKSKQTKATT